MSIHDIKLSRLSLLAILAAFMLTAAPAWARDSLSWDGLTETVSEAPPPSTPTPVDPSLAMATASMGLDDFGSFGASSGTIVGNRAASLRDEVLHLRSSVNLNSNEFAVLRSSGTAGSVQYHSTVAAITARLQNGTTKGNPILLRQWEEANNSLSEVTSSLSKLNSLQVSIDTDASIASYLLGSIQAAFDLSGAVDEDHDQLKLLNDEISRLVVQLDYLRNQTTADIQRQSNYLTTERANIQALAFAISRGEMLGNSLANRPVIINSPAVTTVPLPNNPPPLAAPQAAPTSPVTHGSLDGDPAMQLQPAAQDSGAATDASSSDKASLGHLLVLIRFNQPKVDYEQQLSQAVGTAIERRPNAEFSIVAVTPTTGDPTSLADQQQQAKSDADDVKRSLIQLGLTPARITMASAQSQSAQTPEVHVYIR